MKTFLSITLNPARLLTRPRISPRSNSYRQLMQLPCRAVSRHPPNETVSIGIYCAAPFRGVVKTCSPAPDPYHSPYFFFRYSLSAGESLPEYTR